LAILGGIGAFWNFQTVSTTILEQKHFVCIEKHVRLDELIKEDYIPLDLGLN